MSLKSKPHHFNLIDIFVTFVSLCTFALDIGTDAFVCVELFVDGHYLYGWLMVVFIGVPTLLMNAFSISWHVHDKSVTWPVLLSHGLMLAPAHRYYTVIQLGIKSYQTHKSAVTQRALRCQSDVSILRLFEAFLESAPQLVLQLYIIFHSKHGSWFTGLSTACSLLSLTWAMTAYSDSQRRAHSSLYTRRLIRLLMHWCWQLLMTSARIAAFVFCAFAIHHWVLVVMGGHWLVAFVWISVRGTDFGTDCCERWVFRLVCGFIYIFVFLNLNDGMSRWRVTAYYVLVLLENTGMLVAYLVLKDNAGGILAACVLVYGAYMLGLVCMAVYYSYLHPAGRKKCLQPRGHSTDSGTSCRGEDPQIFSIESPKLENGEVMLEGPGINLTPNTSGSQQSATGIRLSHASDKSSQQSRTVSYVSQQALQAAWRSGMVSSSSSSSTSLASEKRVLSVETSKRTPSVRSLNSQASASSQNELLPAVGDIKNDLSKPPRPGSAISGTAKAHNGSSGSEKGLRGDMSISDNNLNVCSSFSGSPTLSRGSWARLSDHNRQSLNLEEFTVLGFDDDSSLDRRPSDCSSFNSQPKSLSPLNVSGLWKDVHSRLRATIAATIAAATGNPSSSNEGTPSHSRSLASSLSGQEDGVLSANQTAASINHDTIFEGIDKAREERERDDQPNLDAQDYPKKREGLSSLPDIPEAFAQDQMSDMATTDSSYERSGSEAHTSGLPLGCDRGVIEISGRSPSTFSKASFSSYPEDSTLTASKLDFKGAPSYLEAFRLNGLKLDSTPVFAASDQPLDLSMSSGVSTTSPNITLPHKEEKQKNASPFTDQELVAVMAQSLQGYLRDTPGKSPNPEREGLALTIEDLRISRESTPDPQTSKRDAEAWKSRSASSLFHDSTESSPASSASKMNQTASIAKAEAKLSPNAWKQLEISPQSGSNPDSGSPQGTNLCDTKLPKSHGLKFIMDSYAQASLASPNRTAKSLHQHHSYKSHENPLPHKNSYVSSSSELPLISPAVAGKVYHREENLGGVAQAESRRQQKSEHCSFVSSPGPGLSARDLEISILRQQSQTHSGISHTKKLNIHHSSFPVLQYSRSPYRQGSEGTASAHSDTDVDSEAGAYVAGQYHPPLCANIKLESVQNSVDRQHAYDLNSVHQNIHELSFNKDAGNTSSQHSVLPDRTLVKDMRKEVMKKNLRLERHTSDFLHHKPTQLSSSRHSLSNLPLARNVTSLQRSNADGLLYQVPHHQRAENLYNDIMSEEELQMSAKHVADYFSEVLEAGTYPVRFPRSAGSPSHHVHHKRLSQHQAHYKRSPLQQHHKRSPLQQLDNAQHFSPKSNSYYKSMSRPRHDPIAGYTSLSSLKLPPAKSGLQSADAGRDTLRQKLFFDSEHG